MPGEKASWTGKRRGRGCKKEEKENQSTREEANGSVKLSFDKQKTLSLGLLKLFRDRNQDEKH